MRQYLAIGGVSIVLGLSLTCAEQPPSTDAGADPDISACCDWYNPVLRVLFDLPDPRACLIAQTAPGECRWLHCLGGLVEYSYCKPPSLDFSYPR